MKRNYDVAADYRADLIDLIARFRELSPDLKFDNPGEEVVTVVCDALKPEEFADANQQNAWSHLKKQTGACFALWCSAGREWRPLARLVVEENRLLYPADEDFLRVLRLGASELPAEVFAFMQAEALHRTIG